MEEAQTTSNATYWWKRSPERETSCTPAPRQGDSCPACEQGELAFDSLFLLSCPQCGFVAAGGAFT